MSEHDIEPEDDDVAGHLRLTDDQLAAGLTPEAAAKEKSVSRDPDAPRD